MKNLTSYILLFIIGVLCGIGLSHFCRKTGDLPDFRPSSDTLIIRDTIREIKPVPQKVYRRDSILIPVPVKDTIFRTDTQYVWMDREIKTYRSEQYRLQISGIQPSLDWIEVYPTTTTITERIPVKSRPKRWGIGLQAGYGIGLHNGQAVGTPYIGIGISYNLFVW